MHLSIQVNDFFFLKSRLEWCSLLEILQSTCLKGMTLNFPNKIDFISRVYPIYMKGKVEKKFETTISISFLVLFIKQIKAFDMGWHLLVLIQVFAVVWMQLEERRTTCTQRSGVGPLWPITSGKKEMLPPALNSCQSCKQG